MEKITVRKLVQLAESNLVFLVAPPGTGKTTLLKFVSSFTEIPVFDTDAIGYREEDGGVWKVDPGAFRKIGSHMRTGIIAGWCHNIKEVVDIAREQDLVLLGWDLLPDERQRILSVSRQRLRHEGTMLEEDPSIPRALKIAMNLYRRYKFPYRLQSPEEVYVKSNFRWDQASGKAPCASDFSKVVKIVKNSWSNPKDWMAYRKRKGLSQEHIAEIESILKSSDDRVSSQKDGIRADRDSKSLIPGKPLNE